MLAPTQADVPVVILCGGMGARLREGDELLPKPMFDIGGRPVLWHVMKTYGSQGFRRFVLCTGWRGDLIKSWFLHYRTASSDFTLHSGRRDGRLDFHVSHGDEDWTVTFVETGTRTGTGGRLRAVRPQLSGAGTVLVSYADAVADVDLGKVLREHRAAGRIATVTGVPPVSRFGEMKIDWPAGRVTEFNEDSTVADGWVSGGFFAFERRFFDDYLDDDPALLLEERPLQTLARHGQLGVHRHEGFWMGLDTYRDWTHLNRLWDEGRAPWGVR